MATAKKATPTTSKIEVPRPDIVREAVWITGELLVLKGWSQHSIDSLPGGRLHRAGVKAPHPSPEEMFANARYRLPDGRDGLQAPALRAAMIDAAGTFVQGVAKTEARGAFWIETPDDVDLMKIPLAKVDPSTGNLLGYFGRAEDGFIEPRMLESVVRINSKGRGTGTANLTQRPAYDNWAAKVILRYDKSIISSEAAINLLYRAGISIGIGEWRPQKDGQWGQFEVHSGDAFEEPAPLHQAAE